jgi:hypothetical protein
MPNYLRSYAQFRHPLDLILALIVPSFEPLCPSHGAALFYAQHCAVLTTPSCGAGCAQFFVPNASSCSFISDIPPYLCCAQRANLWCLLRTLARLGAFLAHIYAPHCSAALTALGYRAHCPVFFSCFLHPVSRPLRKISAPVAPSFPCCTQSR